MKQENIVSELKKLDRLIDEQYREKRKLEAKIIDLKNQTVRIEEDSTHILDQLKDQDNKRQEIIKKIQDRQQEYLLIKKKVQKGEDKIKN